MALIVQQLTSAAFGIGSTLTVQDILTRVSQDTRFQMGTTGNEGAVLLDYVRRVQLELLRTSRYKFLESPIMPFTTTIGQSDYYIGSSGQPSGSTDTGLAIPDLNVIKRGSVFDRSNYRPLYPTTEKPLSQSLGLPAPPRLWRNDPATPDLLNLYPPPDGAYLIEFRYWQQPVVLANVNDPIQIPDKYQDIFVAGINELAFVFLKRADEAAYWKQIYADGKRSIIRDMNLQPVGSEFIGPDPSTQSSWWFGTDQFPGSITSS